MFDGFRWVQTFVDIPECFPSSSRRICYFGCQCTRCTCRLTRRTVHRPLMAETNVASSRKGVIKGFEEARINILRVQEEYIIYSLLPVSWPPCSPYHFVLTLCLTIRLVWQSEFRTHITHDLMYMKTKELGWKETQGIQNIGNEDSQGNRIVDQRHVL
jgi:hypothetical protein